MEIILFLFIFTSAKHTSRRLNDTWKTSNLSFLSLVSQKHAFKVCKRPLINMGFRTCYIFEPEETFHGKNKRHNFERIEEIKF